MDLHRIHQTTTGDLNSNSLEDSPASMQPESDEEEEIVVYGSGRNDEGIVENGFTNEEEEEIVAYGSDNKEETSLNDEYPRNRVSKEKLIPSRVFSATLYHEKQNIAYPKVMTELKPEEKSIVESSASNGGDHTWFGGHALWGIRKNQETITPLRHSNANQDLHPNCSIHTLRGLAKNGRPIAAKDEIHTRTNPGIPMVRGLRKNDPPNISTKRSMICQVSSAQLTGSDRSVNPSMELEDKSDNEFGIHNEDSTEEALGSTNNNAVSDQRLALAVVSRGSTTNRAPSEPGVFAAANTDSDHKSSSLAEAWPVDEESHDLHVLEARPVHRDIFAIQEARESEDKQQKRAAFGIVAIACMVLIVTLATGLTKKSKDAKADDETITPNGSPTKPLLPLENLDLLYEELPEMTKESLNNSNSPQHQAWEWLLNHPNLSSYPEWRKKQVFAMATFNYSFEGPNWPGSIGSRWMDVTTSECAWVMTDLEVAFVAANTIKMFGPDAYEYQVFYPCNADGQLQTLGVNHLYLPADLKPYIPPEIGLLTSLKLLGIAFGQFSGSELSDWFIPELIHLPNLEAILFRSSGVGGTIPKEIRLMTGLRHLLIGDNAITGTIPPDIARMASLEHFIVGDEEGITGQLPSELGLMTALTGLGIYRTSTTGTVPMELGSLNHLKTLWLDGNRLSSTIPSELGLLTGNTWLALYENRLTGSLPSEMGLMTNTTKFRIWNNALTGSLPSELGLMTAVVDFGIGNDLKGENPNNNFRGSFPTELWELSHLESFSLSSLPNLHGRIPSEMIMPNLTMFSLSGSPHLSGNIPDQACLFVDKLDFDCSDLLCGCECKCTGSTNETNQSVRY